MSWLEKLLPPKIQPTDPSERRAVPEGLWVKCPACETVRLVLSTLLSVRFVRSAEE